MVVIKSLQAAIPADFETARALFVEYAQTLPLEDLEFQDFDGELASIESMYAPPQGALLIARDAVVAAGCVAARRHSDSVCEMKRLYVRDAFRGTGLGRRLAVEVIAVASHAGYRSMRLDTLPSMTAARTLYESLGFIRIEPYYDSPIEGMVFMELDL